MINNNFKKALLVPVLLFSLSIASCNKDNAVQQETEEKIQVEALQKFLAKQLQLEYSSIVFNEETRKFQLPGEYDLQYDYNDVLEIYIRDQNQGKN